MASRTDDLLGSLALERRLISADQLADLLLARNSEGRSVAELLLVRGHINALQLAELSAAAIERATQTITPRTRTPRAAASDPTTARAVEELASDDKYELRGQIAEGGMGRILKAYDKRLRRNVAMKIIRTEHGLTADDLARFIDEAQATAQLEHPNIVPTHEVGLDHDGNLFFTMRLVKGRSLREIIDRKIAGDPAVLREFTATHQLQVIQQICYALSYAHAKGVIHRDLKPENVMLGEFGEVLVMDWGLAKVQGHADRAGAVRTLRTDADASKTLDGMVAGTPAYMAPEQARGELAAVDQQSDVFGVGAILYEILSHRKPIGGKTTTEMLINAAEGKSDPLEKALAGRPVPKEVVAICTKARAPAKAARYPNARALADDIQAFFEGRRGDAWVDTPLSLARKWIVRHRALSAVFATALVALASLSTWFYTRPGGVMIEIDPAGAELSLDGRPIGRAPVELRDVAAGEHLLTMKLPDYEDQAQRITIGRGSRTRFAFVMKSLFATFQIVTEPVVANLTLTDANGVIVAQTISPDTFFVRTGTYKLVAYAPGYLPATLSLESKGGGLYRLEKLTLRDDTAHLDASVYPRDAICTVIDVQTGQTIHRTVVPEDGLKVPAAPIRVRFELANHFEQEFELNPARDQKFRLTASLAPMLWWRSGSRSGRAALGDTDGDGRPEIAIAGLNVALLDGAGHTLWTVPLPLPAILPPAFGDADGDGRDDLFILTPGELLCLQGESGRLLWRRDIELGSCLPVFTPKALLCRFVDRMEAFHPATGAPAWSSTAPLEIRCVPLATAAGVAVLSASGALLSYDSATGAERVLSLDAPPALSRSLPTLTDSLVIVASDLDEQTCDVRAHRLSDGKSLWHRELAGRATAPVVAGATIWIATQSRLLFALNLDTGAVEAKISLPAPPTGTTALGLIDGDDVPDVIVAHDRGVAVFSGATRQPLRSFAITEGVSGSAACADLDHDGAPELVLTTKSGEIAVVRSAASPWRWRQPAVATTLPPLVAGPAGREQAVLVAGERDLLLVDVASGRTQRAAVKDEMGAIRCIGAADLRGKGSVDWIAMDDRGTLAVGEGGVTRWLKRDDLFRGMPASMQVTNDVDGDRTREILVLWAQRIALFSGADGTVLWERPLVAGEAAAVQQGEIHVLDAEQFQRLALTDGRPSSKHAVLPHHPTLVTLAEGPRFIAYYVTLEGRLTALSVEGVETTVLETPMKAWALRALRTADGPALLVSPIGALPFVLWPHSQKRVPLKLFEASLIVSVAPGADGELLVGTSRGRLETLSLPSFTSVRAERIADDGPVLVAPVAGGAVVLSSKSGLLGALRAPAPRRPQSWGFEGLRTQSRVFRVQ